MKNLKIIPFIVLIHCIAIGYAIKAQKTKVPEKKLNPVAEVKNTVGEFNSKERYALVIGNQSYPKIPLDFPISDAKTLSRSLKEVGFKVTEKFDLGIAQMRLAITEFSQQIPKGGVALLFFAGHGVQVSGKNFLLPVDYSDIKVADDFVKQMVDLDSIVNSMSQKSALNIIILDACRNNPTALSLPVAVEEGLAPFKQKTSAGIFIAYSTSPHTTALDDSPYIRSLSKNILMNPGRIEDVFIKTRIDVENETGERQIPWETVSLKTIFYFKSSEPVKIPDVKPTEVNTTNPALPFGISALQTFPFVAPIISDKGRRTSVVNGVARYFIESSNNIGLEMVEIKGGEFEMGSSSAEVEMAFADAKKYKGEDSDDEGEYIKKESKDFITAEMPKHRVKTPSFFMSKYEITQKQWRDVMGRMPAIPKNLQGDNLPVVSISWEEANSFCDKLTDLTGRFYRLPSEAEWEYAAKAGKNQAFGYGDNINASVANYFVAAPYREGSKEQNRLTILPVGSLNAANSFGLYDIHGNVAEWTADFWNDSYSGAPIDGTAWQEADEDNQNYRVIRGGGYDSIGNDCRAAARRKHPAVVRSPKIGFRVVVK